MLKFSRWEELQRQGPEIVEVDRRLNNPVPGNQYVVPIHDDDTEDLIQLSPPSTSGNVYQQQFNEMTNHNATTSHNNNLRKKLIAVRQVSISIKLIYYLYLFKLVNSLLCYNLSIPESNKKSRCSKCQL